MKESVVMSGDFHLKVFKNGVLIKEYTDKNLIVRLGRDLLARLIGGNISGKYVTKIAFGVNGNPPLSDDNSIVGGITKTLESSSYSTLTPSVSFQWILETTEMNGLEITEFGLLCNDNSLFARKTNEPIIKDSSIGLEGIWTLNF